MLSPVVVVVVVVVCCVLCVRRRCNAFNKQDDVALDDDCSARGLLCSALAAALEPPLSPPSRTPFHTPPPVGLGHLQPRRDCCHEPHNEPHSLRPHFEVSFVGTTTKTTSTTMIAHCGMPQRKLCVAAQNVFESDANIKLPD